MQHRFRPACLSVRALGFVVLATLLATGCLCGSLHAEEDSTAPKSQKLNVLMIAVDDLRPELNCYGASHIHSQAIDRLAAEGTRFDLAYCQVAVCGASRASLLSGCRPETTGCWDYKTPMRSRMPDVLSLPQHFRQSGYETSFLGKVYHSASDDPQGWSLPASKWAPQDKSKGKSWLKPRSVAVKPGAKGSKVKEGPSIENGGDVPDDAYVDGHNAERAVEMLKRFSKHDKPFFLAVGFIKPHLPFNAPKKYWDLYERDSIEVPSREDVIDGVSYARSSWGELKNYPDVPRNVATLDDAKSRELIHGYYAATSYMDAQVGKLLTTLDDLKLRDNTIIVLWGDHGWYLGDFGDWCKHSNYEVATRVPLIISAPGFKAGQVTSGLTEFVDIFPTLCELAGIPIPKHCQGISAVPLLRAPERDWKPAAFSQYKKGKTGTGTMLGTSIRTDRFRYTEWRHSKTGALDAVELIDFDKDPHAKRNVASDPQYKNHLKQLEVLCSLSATGVRPKAVDE